FILQAMPPGLLGLVIAAIIAATMSTLSGTINALAASATHDIYLPITGRAASDPRTLRVGKRLALFWGFVLTVGALLYRQQGTPVVVIALSIASFTYGGLLGGFFLALFVPRARQRDAIVGMSVGIAAMAIVVFAKQLASAYPSLATSLGPLGAIAWPWYVLIGTILTLLTGTLSSFARRPRPDDAPAT
ncbi:MAG: sodium:solute symporter family transporter, partial [Gemmatimonadaceae bacterium]